MDGEMVLIRSYYIIGNLKGAYMNLETVRIKFTTINTKKYDEYVG